MPKSKTSKLNKKLSFKNPALVIVVTLLVAAGVFLAFKTFASDGTVTASVSGKDAYGCPLDPTQRPTVKQGSSGACVKTLRSRIGSLGNKLPSLSKYYWIGADGIFDSDIKDAVILIKQLTLGKLLTNDVVGPYTWRYIDCLESTGGNYKSCNDMVLKGVNNGQI